MHSLKGIFKHKSKSESFLLNDSIYSTDEEKEDKKKLKEIKKNSSKKSNKSILKSFGKRSTKISNIELENESLDKLKNQTISNDINVSNNEVKVKDQKNSAETNIPNNLNVKDQKNEAEANIPNTLNEKDHKKHRKELPAIRTLKEIGNSASMPVISPSVKNPYFSEDEESNITEKSKKEIKKELKIEKKKKKKELKEQKKKEKDNKKMQENLEKGEFYAINNDKSKKKIKKEYKKMKKEKKKGINMDNISETTSFSSNFDNKSTISTGTENVNDNLQQVTVNSKNASTNNNKTNNENENYVSGSIPINESENEIKSGIQNIDNVKNKEISNNDIKECISEKVKKEEKENKEIDDIKEKEEEKMEEKNKIENENESKENHNIKDKENKEIGNVKEKEEMKEKNENENENDNNKVLDEHSEKKKQEIEEIEDELPLAILRYKSPQPHGLNTLENTKNNDDDDDEEKPLYVVKLKYDNRKTVAGKELRKSVSASDLLSRVRRSMALRNSGYFSSGVPNSNSKDRINMPKCRSFNALKPFNDDEDDDLTLAAIKEKRSSFLNQLAELNANHPINSSNRNTFSNSGLKNSHSAGCLNSYNRNISNGYMVGPMNGMVMNGAPMNGMAMNSTSINGIQRNSLAHSPEMKETAPNMAGKRSSIINNGRLMNSKSSLSFDEFNKFLNEQEIQRKRQSIIESNKRRTQIMMTGHVSNEKMKKSNSDDSIESGHNSNNSLKKINSNEKLNKVYENEIQEYPGQKFITFTPMEYNTFPTTASLRVIPGQSKRDKIQRRSLAVEVQAPKESFIPIETKDHNYMQIENLKYKKQKRKEHQEYEDKITSWINNSAAPQQQSSQSKRA
ncbi:hypothetical protein LY90DRAFT_665372 [Neocallimastix californiae]|jgi:hypothetical protein|uniref:Uncharacterized protein n=1 Tax=Neocallimastix californiae TaxID=1754190 RepID=A0A1Y2EZV3_9FUNG|nr:hypothetical protein LY90DRAFT_665372 [Neocallimastix californiae]|eukprot:ORY77113.1 hypothetical protein LY90DRAFT_665372 [Neocallimastix californiae]